MDGLPREIERKYLIKRPDEETLSALPEVSASEIFQAYLGVSEDGMGRRIRRRGTKKQGYKYYYTKKKEVSFGERIEIEKEITKAEFDKLLGQTDPEREPIEKTRYVFKFSGQTFELDVYPFSEDYATLEIELDDINKKVVIPEEIEVIKDVTGDKRYYNAMLAENKRLDPDMSDG